MPTESKHCVGTATVQLVWFHTRHILNQHHMHVSFGHAWSHMHVHLHQRRLLGASQGVERERWGRLEDHFQSERETPHQTCCMSAVVNTAQVNSDRGQLGLVPQCEVSDYWPDKQEGHLVRSPFAASVHRRVRDGKGKSSQIWHQTKKTMSNPSSTHTWNWMQCTHMYTHMYTHLLIYWTGEFLKHHRGGGGWEREVR